MTFKTSILSNSLSVRQLQTLASAPANARSLNLVMVGGTVYITHLHAGVRFLAEEIARKAEVRDAYMSVLIQQNVGRLHTHKHTISIITTTASSTIPSVYCGTSLVSCFLSNSLPLDIQSSPSITYFPSRAQDIFSRKSFPTFYYDIYFLTVHAFVDSVIVSLFEPR